MESGRPTWRPRAWLVAAGVLAGLALVLATVGIDGQAAAWVAAWVATGIAAAVLGWALLRTRTQHRRYERDLAAWAAERATQTERLRIAGDLHDLVSHGLGLITVRAAAARATTGPAGEAERAAALADVEQVSRATTTELRRMLAVLRDPGAAPLRPADTFADLPGIVRETRAAGLTADLDLDAGTGASPGAQLTACAVVREALHNTLRHAGPTRARVVVRRDGAAIVVDVRDDGPRGHRPPHPGAGHGLDGLRGRVSALGGTLRAAPDGTGFRVVARLPDRDGP